MQADDASVEMALTTLRGNDRDAACTKAGQLSTQWVER